MKILKSTFLLLSTFIFSQVPTIDWQKTFGGSEDDYGYALLATSDNYLIVGGQTSSSDGTITENLGGWDAWLIKYDADGNEIWKNAYGGSDWDVIWNIKETLDGNYIFFAISGSVDGDIENNLGETDFWIVKINTDGEIIWKKNYGGSGLEDGGEVLSTSDNGYILIGSSSSNDGNFPDGNGDFDYAIIKIDGTGEVEWSKSFGGSELDMALNGIVDEEDNILVTGFSYSSDGDFNENRGSGDIWVLKLNPEGNLMWKKNIGGSAYEQSYCIQQIVNGNYLVGINSSSDDIDFDENYGGSDVWLFELNTGGEILNKKHYGGSLSEVPMEMDELPNGDLVIAGTTYSSNGDISQNHGNGDFWFVKLNQEGEILWEKNYGGSQLDRLWRMVKFDNGYAAIGEIESNDNDVTNNHGGFDFWTLKLNPENLGINENIFTDLNIYPNPTSGKIYFQTRDMIDLIELYDSSGKFINKFTKDEFLNGVDISNLISGTYILKTKIKGKVYTKKIIKN